jgi:dienelactone hydrolase
VSFSPDGTHFVAVTIRGNLSSDKRVASMWLFDTAQVSTYMQRAGQLPLPRARVLVRCASASNQPPMSHWRWSSNGRSLLFLCADDAGANHLERVTLDGGMIATMSGAGQDVSGFDGDNGHVVYLARTRIGAEDLHQAGGPSLPDIEDGTGESLLNLVFPKLKSVSSFNEEPLYEIAHGMPVAVRSATYGRPIHLGGGPSFYTAGPKLTIGPNGGLLLATAYVQRVPRSWERYRSAWVAAKIVPFVPDTSTKRGMVGVFRPQEYVLVDLEKGRVFPLIDAPIDWGPLFYNPVAGAWSPDGSQLAVTGVFPPLRGTTLQRSSGGASGIAPCAIAVIDLKPRRFSCTQPHATLESADTPSEERKRVISLVWSNNRVLIATYATQAAANRPAIIRYSEDPSGRWHAQRESRSTRVDGLRVYVEQALNQPPVLMASLPGESARILIDPNPQLKDIALGRASLYRWKDASGKLRTGALVTPPDFSPNRRYPLVIQTGPLNFGKFLVDGLTHTAFAARALAARDIVVLQVPDIGKDKYDTPGFMTENASNYRAAIQQLARSGVIDPHRVGIIGFSHTGVFVMENLIEDSSAFKAASLAEASSSSYSEFLADVDHPSDNVGQNYMAHYLGAWPWGDGLKVWLARSPGFHTDSICAPILYQENSSDGLVFLGWEDYAILRAQHKPVDLLYIRNGTHALIQPHERLVEQQMNVDWFDYWLNGHKSSHPAMPGEYQRWDDMRKTLPTCPASDTRG